MRSSISCFFFLSGKRRKKFSIMSEAATLFFFSVHKDIIKS